MTNRQLTLASSKIKCNADFIAYLGAAYIDCDLYTALAAHLLSKPPSQINSTERNAVKSGRYLAMFSGLGEQE